MKLTSGYIQVKDNRDFRKLVKLTRAWKYAHHGPSRRMLSRKLESLYYRVYGTVCYFDNF